MALRSLRARGAYDLVDPLAGIANGCRTLPLDPGGPSVFQVTVRMGDTSPYLGVRGDHYNSGAGLDEQSAWDAGIGEAIERYCVSSVMPDRLVFGPWRELDSRSLAPVHPSEVALFEPSQQELGPRVHFEETTPLSWHPAVSLITRRARVVPACLAHIPYAPVHTGEQLIAPAISTGCACGPTRDDALLLGLYEAIERDAFSIVWRNRLPMPRLVIDEPDLVRLFEQHFARPQLEYHLFLLQLDQPVPTVISLIRDRNFAPPVHSIGGACRSDVRHALVKALIESVQGWAWARYYRLKEGLRPRPPFDEVHSFEDHVRLYACSEMSDAVAFLVDGTYERAVSSFPRVAFTRAKTILPLLINAVAATGTDVILLDMTTDDIRDLDLTVVRVFCPAFEQVEGDHNFPLLGGPRWRQVPVDLGLMAQPPSFEAINPFPHPYP